MHFQASGNNDELKLQLRKRHANLILKRRNIYIYIYICPHQIILDSILLIRKKINVSYKLELITIYHYDLLYKYYKNIVEVILPITKLTSCK